MCISVNGHLEIPASASALTSALQKSYFYLKNVFLFLGKVEHLCSFSWKGRTFIPCA